MHNGTDIKTSDSTSCCLLGCSEFCQELQPHGCKFFLNVTVVTDNPRATCMRPASGAELCQARSLARMDSHPFLPGGQFLSVHVL